MGGFGTNSSVCKKNQANVMHSLHYDNFTTDSFGATVLQAGDLILIIIIL